MLEIILSVFTLFITSVIYWYFSIPKKLPPGPIGLPFLGTIIHKKHPSEQLRDLSRKYNSGIVSLYIFNKLFVIINDAENLKEIYVRQGDKVVDKNQTLLKEVFRNDDISAGNYGILLSNGPIWKEHRRFAVATLRDFGAGRPILENAILEEVEAVLEELDFKNQQPFDVQQLITNAVCNIVCRLVYGQRFEYSDPEFVHALSCLNRVAVGPHPISGLIFLKRWMLHLIPGAMATLREIWADLMIFRGFVIRQIQLHEKSYPEIDDPKDYIHAYFKKRDQNTKTNTFTDPQLIVSVADLFAAGTETTSTTLRWSILFCAVYEDIQDRVFREISENIGTNRLPTFPDRTSTPYTEAFLLETFRHGTPIPLAGRQAMENIYVNGYCIPKGTPVMNNIWAVNWDPKNYDEPEKFAPERFLTPEGKVKRDDLLYPFSVGKRICPGESLARMELFLFFAGIIQRFRFKIPDGEPIPSLEQIHGITIQPQPFRIIAEPRYSS